MVCELWCGRVHAWSVNCGVEGFMHTQCTMVWKGSCMICELWFGVVQTVICGITGSDWERWCGGVQTKLCVEGFMFCEL